MLKDIIEVTPGEGYTLFIQFEDGVKGQVTLDELVAFEGVFEPLRDPTEFRKVRVHPELKVVCWPNGADLDPDVLYARLTGSPIPLLAQGGTQI